SGRRAALPIPPPTSSFSPPSCCCSARVLGLLPPPPKPRPGGVWALLDLPEAGKPAAGWGRVGGGGGAVRHNHCLRLRPPHPTHPHKGEGSRPSLPRAHISLRTNAL